MNGTQTSLYAVLRSVVGELVRVDANPTEITKIVSEAIIDSYERRLIATTYAKIAENDDLTKLSNEWIDDEISLSAGQDYDYDHYQRRLEEHNQNIQSAHQIHNDLDRQASTCASSLITAIRLSELCGTLAFPKLSSKGDVVDYILSAGNLSPDPDDEQPERFLVVLKNLLEFGDYKAHVSSTPPAQKVTHPIRSSLSLPKDDEELPF